MDGHLADLINKHADHERRLSVVESEMEHLAPKIEVKEQLEPLRMQVQELAGNMNTMTRTVAEGHTQTQAQLEKLSSSVETAFKQLSEVNADNMRKNGQQVAEKHERDLRERDAAIEAQRIENEKLRAQFESSRFVNQIKDKWAPILGFIIAGAAVFTITVTIFVYALKAVGVHISP